MKYDDFNSAELSAGKWLVGEYRDAEGQVHAYYDPNTQIATGGGQVRLTIDPFTRFHDSVPALNNPKTTYRSRERFATPPGSRTLFEVDMAVETFRALPGDLRDAFATFNVVDHNTGVVFDFAVTNEIVYIIHERLLLPGVTTPEMYFAHRIVLEVDTNPGQAHHYGISYERNWSRAEWFVDGKKVYEATVPTEVDGFRFGFGLFSSRRLDKFSREEREHGQGASGTWSNFSVETR